jgi:hypothetical protein
LLYKSFGDRVGVFTEFLRLVFGDLVDSRTIGLKFKEFTEFLAVFLALFMDILEESILGEAII